MIFLKSDGYFQIFRLKLVKAICKSFNCGPGVNDASKQEHILALYGLQRVLDIVAATWLYRHNLPYAFHHCLRSADVSLLDMVRLELCLEAALRQFLLQVSVELERVVLGHDNANFLLLRREIPQNALSHSLKSAKDEAVGNDDARYEGLEAPTYIEVAKLELHIASSQINGRQAGLRVALPRVVGAVWAASLGRLDNHARHRSGVLRLRLR